MRVAPEQLAFLGLVALDEVVQHCRREPYPRTFALPATLAMLHALAGGDSGPYVAFWRACAIPNGPEHQAFGGRQQRGNEVGSAYRAICRAVAGGETVAMGQDVASARSDPGPHARAYQERHRVEDAHESARRVYAEALRRSGGRPAAVHD